MAQEGEKRKGPRIRVRIPTVNGGGDSSPPPSSQTDAAAMRRREDYGRRLTFELEVGELPNVLQFLSTDKRTGKLDLTVRNQPNAGYIFFEDGVVYLARYRNYEGVDALARVVNSGRVRAVFTNGAQSGERNVDIPVSALLLEVLVRADELAAEGETDAAPPPRYKVSAAGSPAAKSSSALIELPPPPADETGAAANSVGAGGAGAGRVIRRRLQDEAEVEPPASTPLSIKRRRQVPVDEMAPAKPRKRIFRRLVVLVFELALLAALITAVYWAYDRYLRELLPRDRKVVEEVEQVDLREAELDAALLGSWLASARQAVERRDYREAEGLIEQVLMVDPEQREALELRARVDREDAPAIARRLAELAVSRAGEVGSLRSHEWAEERVLRVENLLQAADKLFEAAQFEGAVKAYRATVEVADQLIDLRRNYQLAVERHGLMNTFKVRAEAAEVIGRADGLWTEALLAEREGGEFFARADFAQAASAWERAGLLFQRAAAHASMAGDVERLARDFKMNVAANEQVKRSPEANLLLGEAAALADEAERLSQQGELEKARAAWREATARLRRASSLADISENRQRYEELLAAAEKALAEDAWQAAREGFNAVLAVPGFADDAVALRGLFQAERGMLAARMKQAEVEERWQDAKTAAEELFKLDVGNREAVGLLARIKEKLVVDLTIQAVHDGKPAPGARVLLGGESEARTLPTTVELQVDETYHIRVWAPPKDEIFFDAFTTIYEARTPGRDTLTAPLHVASGPERGRAWRVPGINLEMVYIRPGEFSRGSEHRQDERPVHGVTISQPFWIGLSEVTNQQYRDFLAATEYDGRRSANSGYLRHFDGSSAMSAERNHPVCYVSWKNAMAFCEWLTQRETRGNRLPEGYAYRLPTEAEWEYCATEGGGLEIYNLDELGWYMMNSKVNQPVQQLKPNAWGLFDMLGNVWEMCYDYYGRYPMSDVVDPVGPQRGVLRIMRGGSHANPPDLCRPHYRSSVGWMDARANVGFRIVLAPTIEELKRTAAGRNGR